MNTYPLRNATGSCSPPCFLSRLSEFCRVVLVLAVLAVSPTAFAVNPSNECDGTADDPDTCIARTTGNGKVCAGDLFGANLTCTANDVVVAKVTNIRDTASGEPIDSCFQGSTLNFTADFDVQVSGGVTRFDIGLYFSTDGDPNKDGAETGGCSVSKLSDGNPNDGNGVSSGNDKNYKQLDAAPDSCGDVDKSPKLHKVNLPLSIPCVPSPLYFNPTTKACQATAPFPGASNCVSLPNIVSWRQTGANDTCVSPLGTYPGAPSKCRSDINFGIPVKVEPVQISVQKTANPTSLPEPGGAVTFTVEISTDAQFSDLILSSLNDDVFGDLLDANNAAISNSDCDDLAGQTIGPGGTLSCSFSASITGNAGFSHTDTVTACGTANDQQSCNDDDATVNVINLSEEAADPTVTKDVYAWTMDVTYKVQVNNNSSIDTLTVNSLMDNKFGDITTMHAAGGGFEQVVNTDCVSGGTISPGGNYNCTFVGRISSSGANPHVNTVTADVTDDDTINYTPTDSATVNVSTP